LVISLVQRYVFFEITYHVGFLPAPFRANERQKNLPPLPERILSATLGLKGEVCFPFCSAFRPLAEEVLPSKVKNHQQS
jgi:hypothetical protein